jgi:hypothetical protein
VKIEGGLGVPGLAPLEMRSQPHSFP